MRILTTDIWKLVKTHLIVVPTNLGWDSKGHNVMGKGLAKDAAKRYPSLPSWYGNFCRTKRQEAEVTRCPGTPILLFPVKPLNAGTPWLSWRSKADLALIERSTRQLSHWSDDVPIAVPLVGCGAGGLDPADVRPILQRHLMGSQFVLVISDGANVQRQIRRLMTKPDGEKS